MSIVQDLAMLTGLGLRRFFDLERRVEGLEARLEALEKQRGERCNLELLNGHRCERPKGHAGTHWNRPDPPPEHPGVKP